MILGRAVRFIRDYQRCSVVCIGMVFRFECLTSCNRWLNISFFCWFLSVHGWQPQVPLVISSFVRKQCEINVRWFFLFLISMIACVFTGHWRIESIAKNCLYCRYDKIFMIALWCWTNVVWFPLGYRHVIHSWRHARSWSQSWIL